MLPTNSNSMSPCSHVSCLQELCQSTVRKIVVEETGKTLKVQAGWYTERQMKDTLKMPKWLA